MEKIILKKDIEVFGIQVSTFPAGVKEAFDELIEKTGDIKIQRNYYGVSRMNEKNNIIYQALVEQNSADEAENLGYEKSKIEKGEYFFMPLYNWMDKTNCIKDIFMEMMKDERTDKASPGVEWYKNDNEMLCMMKAINNL